MNSKDLINLGCAIMLLPILLILIAVAGGLVAMLWDLFIDAITIEVNR